MDVLTTCWSFQCMDVLCKTACAKSFSANAGALVLVQRPEAHLHLHWSFWMFAAAQGHMTSLCWQNDDERKGQEKLTYTYPKEQFSCCRMTANTPACRRKSSVGKSTHTLISMSCLVLVWQLHDVLWPDCNQQWWTVVYGKQQTVPHIHRQPDWVNESCQMPIKRWRYTLGHMTCMHVWPSIQMCVPCPISWSQLNND